MNLSSRTLTILKNFATINGSLLVKPGSALRTISANKTIMATSSVAEIFDREFAIYDLNQFLGAIALIGDGAELVFDEKFVSIVPASGGRGIKFFYADPSLVVAPPSKQITLPSTEVNFKITAAALGELLKACAVLQLPEIVIKSDGKSATQIGAVDTKNSTSNSLFIDVADHTSDVPFQFIFKAENLKIMAGDYEVSITAKGMGQFDGVDTRYFIATESSSRYGK